MQKVLITGASGFVGLNINRLFSKNMNYQLIPYYRHDSMDKILETNPDYIIHCGAEVYNTENMFDSNIKLTYDLLNACKNVKNLKNFVYIGSSSEYGRKVTAISEEDFLEPDTMYEGTKACGSMLTRVFGKLPDTHFNTCIARPFSLYGPFEKQKKLIPTLYTAIMNDTTINIAGGVHDWIYIDDFVSGIELLMNSDNCNGEFFNFGCGIQYTNLQVLNIMSDVIGKKINYNLVDNINTSAGVDSECWKVRYPTKATLKLNWKFDYTLEDGIKKYVEYRQNTTT